MAYIDAAMGNALLLAEGNVDQWPETPIEQAQFLERASRRIDQLAFAPHHETPKSPRYTDGYLTDADKVEVNAIPHVLAVQVALLALWYAQNPNSFYNRSPAGEESLCQQLSDIPLSIQTGLWGFVGDEVKIDVDQLPAKQQDRATGGSLYHTEEHTPSVPATPVQSGGRGIDAEARREATEAQAQADAATGKAEAAQATADKAERDAATADGKAEANAAKIVELEARPSGGTTLPEHLQAETLILKSRAGRIYWEDVNAVPDTPGEQSALGHVLTVTGTGDKDYLWQQAPHQNQAIDQTARNSAGSALTKAEAAQALATTADGKADAATTAAHNAQSTADTAQATADVALTDAMDAQEAADAAQLDADTVLDFFPPLVAGETARRNLYLSIKQPINAYQGADICQVTIDGATPQRLAYTPGTAEQVITVGITKAQLDNLANNGDLVAGNFVGVEVRFQIGSGTAQDALKFFRRVLVPVEVAPSADVDQVARDAATAAQNTANSALSGIPAKATNTDVDGESDDTKYMTVLKVFRAIARKVKIASNRIAGIVRLSTQAEADAGINTTTAMTPALVKRRIDAAGGGLNQIARATFNVGSNLTDTGITLNIPAGTTLIVFSFRGSGAVWTERLTVDNLPTATIRQTSSDATAIGRVGTNTLFLAKTSTGRLLIAGISQGSKTLTVYGL